MEKEIKSNEWLLHRFLEQKDFSSLSHSEKKKIEDLISEEEYAIRRLLIITAEEENEGLVPLPLILSGKNKGIVIPLHQAVLAIVATVLVMLFLKFPYSNLDAIKRPENIKYVSVTDTIKEIEYVYDTIYKEIVKTKLVEKTVYIPQTRIKSNEVLNAPNSYQIPDLKTLINEVDGSESLAEDVSIGLLPNMVYRD